MKKINFYTALIISLFTVACNSDKTNTEEENSTEKIELVNNNKNDFVYSPSLRNGLFNYEKHEVEAEEGGTIITEKGSELVFPANSMVDANGKLIKGKVDIEFTDISSPLDFALSGISMKYDSAGVTYSFESSAMCDIKASQNGNEVFVNKKNKPTLNLATTNIDEGHNIYLYNEETKTWTVKAKSKIKNNPLLKLKKEKPIAKLVKPSRLDKNKQSFGIIIEPGSISELDAYNNLQFEIIDNENYNPKDSRIEWENVTVEKTKKTGEYIVIFTKGSRKVSYLTKPVFEGIDYDSAIAKYNNLKNEREEKIAEQKRKYEELIIFEKKRVEKERIEWEKRQKEWEIANKKRLKQDSLDQKDKNIVWDLQRSFSIDGFGIWNSDKVILYKSYEITAHFKNKQGELLDIILDNRNIISKGVNGIFDFKTNNIKVFQDNDFAILATYNGNFMYLSYSQIKKYKVKDRKKPYIFNMNKYNGKLETPEDKNKLYSLLTE